MTALKISLSATALRDAERIADHLEREAGRAVAVRFAAELEELFDRLRSMPKMGRNTSRKNLFVIMLGRFPYHVIYRTLDRDELKIVRIRHARRRPLTWI